MDLTLAEETLLTSQNSHGNPLVDDTVRAYGVAGALLLDLALHGHVVVRDNRVVPVDASGTGDATVGPEAEALLQRIRADARPRRPKKWVKKAVADKAYRDVAAGLAERGVLRAHKRRVLGLFPVQQWSEQDPGPAATVHARLHAAVIGAQADDRTVALLMLIDACGLSAKVFTDIPVPVRKTRLTRLTMGPWDRPDVAEAVPAITKDVTIAIQETDSVAPV